jgi:parallel beta-helix repeat protein
MFVTMVNVGASPAGAEACGLEVSGNYTLTGDITGCTSTAIVVTGDNLVLDLAGHVVSCEPNTTGEGPGIYVPNHTGVTIRNGTVQYCDTGIYLEEGGGHTLTNLNVRDNVGSLHAESIFGEGIQLYGSHDNKITNNRIIHNGTYAGIDMFDSSRNTFTANTVDANNVIQTNSMHGGPTIMQDIGVWIVFLGDFPGGPGATGNLVSNNTVSNSGLDGVQLSTGSRANTVQYNTIQKNGCGQVPGIRNGDGIAVFGQQSLMQGNQVVQNCGNGIYVRNGRLNHRILSNQTLANNTKPGTSPQFDLKDDNVNCDNNLWQNNPQGTRNRECIH